MLGAPASRVPSVRLFSTAMMIALFAASLFVLMTPAASATPTPPYFGPNVQVDRVPAYTAGNPSLAVGSDGVAYLAFAGWGGTVSQTDIYYANSTDAGVSFNPSIRVNNDASTAEQGQPAIAIGPDRSVNVVWSDPRTGARGRDIMFAKSSNRGLSWGPNVVVNDDTGNAI